MSSQRALSRAEAREVVKQISKKHGFVSDDILARIEPVEVREQIRDAMYVKDGLIGAAIITLAKNIYTSNARFIFELLQNADDNQYTRPAEPPFVSFHLHKDRVVVEYNEDGFTKENLEAICNVDRSTKKNSHGYIGEKGIGFKSVFMVAWKVLIHSGSYSFSFQHRKGGSGFGMISPIWEESSEDSDEPLTRVTLFFHEDLSAEDLEALHSSTLEQLRGLQVEFLLFLRKIKRINVFVYGEDGSIQEEARHSIESFDLYRSVIKKRTVAHGVTEDYSQLYHITRRKVTGLARSDNREYNAAAEASRSYATSEVVLAFPLTDSFKAIISSQSVFAFLPIRNAGFSFLIQADFVTEGSRQDVVSCARNQGLLNGIANAFVTAAAQFCEHSSLVWEWMLYLPDPQGLALTAFWKTLPTKIQTAIATKPLLRSYADPGGALLPIGSLRMLTSRTLDQHGRPLISDYKPYIYLSLDYNEQKTSILRSYGLQYIFVMDILNRLRHDLGLQNSVYKSSKDDDWHSRVAKMLVKWIDKSPENLSTIREMSLIPLKSGSWFSSLNSMRAWIFFATTGGVDIPGDLGLHLVDPAAAANRDRKTLFEKLYVQIASKTMVRDSIFAYYRNRGNNSFTLDDSKSHLKFLFLVLKNRKRPIDQDWSAIEVIDQSMYMRLPNVLDVYLPDNKQYGVKNILAKSHLPDQHKAPGLETIFLHQAYLDNKPEAPEDHVCNWEHFLSEFLSIRREPRLVLRGSSGAYELSPILNYLHEHRSDIFLQVLRHYWRTQGWELKHETICKTIRGRKFRCGTGNTRAMRLLKNTYLPLYSLTALQAKYTQPGEPSIFLDLGPLMDGEAEAQSWEFLCSYYKVGDKADLAFYTDLLETIIEANHSAATLVAWGRVYTIYEQMALRAIEEKLPPLKFLTTANWIYVPVSEHRRACWARVSDCIWRGPDMLTTKRVLKPICTSNAAAQGCNPATLQNLFTSILKIQDCTAWDLVTELQTIQSSQTPDFDTICSLYRYIAEWTAPRSSTDVDTLRSEFEKYPLIYVHNNGSSRWLKVSECVWSSSATIRGRVSIKDDYEDMEDFFVDLLDVQQINFDLLEKELRHRGTAGTTSIDEMKSLLLTFSALIDADSVTKSASRIRGARIYPVRTADGRSEFSKAPLSPTVAMFGVIDRQMYAEAFSGRANLLDFTLEEVQTLRPFLEWSGLDSWYLSRIVKEITTYTGGTVSPDSHLTRSFRKKAHGLYRIAAHFNSPRVVDGGAELLDVLMRTDVYQTGNIASQLVMNLDGHRICVDLEKSELHLSDRDEHLEVYVSSETTLPRTIYRTKLPRSFMRWLLTDPQTQIAMSSSEKMLLTITNVMSADPIELDYILMDAGIANVSIEEGWADAQTHEETSSPASAHDDSDLASNQRTSFAGRSGPASIARSETTSSETTTDAEEEENESDDEDNAQVTPQESVASPPAPDFSARTEPRFHSPQASFSATSASRSSSDRPVPATGLGNTLDVGNQQYYAELLRTIVSAARRAIFPGVGIFDMSGLAAALSNEEVPAEYDPTKFRSISKFVRDSKIGAAGELFVFELLKGYADHLPGFCLENWQSSMRKYAQDHPEYADISHWSLPETSDIVYDDTTGSFTAFLIEKGYLPFGQFSTRRPYYYIEVKTTTGQCQTQFYMSKYQYSRLQKTSETNLFRERDAVYIVFRVSEVTSGMPKLRLYVDPEAHRRRGELVFTAETWTVVPGRRAL